MASPPDDSGSKAATRDDSTTDSDHVLYPSAGVIVWSRDITDRKHAEHRLAHQAQVLDNAPEAIVATDEPLVITTWNRAAESLYGWTAAEVIGRDIREVLRPALDTRPWDELFRISKRPPQAQRLLGSVGLAQIILRGSP